MLGFVFIRCAGVELSSLISRVNRGVRAEKTVPYFEYGIISRMATVPF